MKRAMEIVIVEYGLGNPGSILNMLKYLDMDAVISNDHKEIKNADKLILPGVGAFDNGMLNLRETGLLEVLNEKVLVKKTPILGICLGMQLMALQSEEGILNGLGWINATVKRFTPVDGLPLKIPHTGWNKIEVCRANPITDQLEDESKFYFVHAYHVSCQEQNLAAGKTKYGISFDSVVAKDNIFGCQFHPEKSHKHGMRIFRNFQKI